MRYVSLDLETSSLQPHPDHVLGVSMVIEDTNNPMPLNELPHFTCLVRHEEYRGQAVALAMNAWILKELSSKTPTYPIYDAKSNFSNYFVSKLAGQVQIGTWQSEAIVFLHMHFGEERATLAGKNVGVFDYQFLPEPLQKMFRHRMIDPGSMFIDFATDSMPPSLGEIKKRTGIDAEGVVSHNMYEDALDVISVLRTKYAKGSVG